MAVKQIHNQKYVGRFLMANQQTPESAGSRQTKNKPNLTNQNKYSGETP